VLTPPALLPPPLLMEPPLLAEPPLPGEPPLPALLAPPRGETTGAPAIGALPPGPSFAPALAAPLAPALGAWTEPSFALEQLVTQPANAAARARARARW